MGQNYKLPIQNCMMQFSGIHKKNRGKPILYGRFWEFDQGKA